MVEAISLTLNEAGYVMGQSSTAINRAVDRGVIKAELRRRGKLCLYVQAWKCHNSRAGSAGVAFADAVSLG